MAGLADLLGAIETAGNTNVAALDKLADQLEELVKHFSTVTEATLDWAEAVDDAGVRGEQAGKRVASAWQGLRTAMAPVQKIVSSATAAVQAFGARAQLAYGIASASIMGFVRAGMQGTYQGERFGVVMGFLSREVASIFKPAIDGVIESLEKMVGWFRALDGSQQDMIFKFAEGAAAGLLVVAVLPKIVAGITGVIGAVTALASATSVLDVMTGGILPLVGVLVTAAGAVVALGVGAAVAQGGFKGILETLKPITDVLTKGFGQAWAAMQPLLDALGSHFGKAAAQGAQFLADVLAQIIPLASDIARAMTDMVESLGGPLLEQGRMIQNLALEVLPSLVKAIQGSAKAIAFLARLFGDLLGQVNEVAKWLNNVRIAMLQMVPATDAWRGALEALIPGMKQINDLLRDEMALRLALRGMTGGTKATVDEIIRSAIEKFPDKKKDESGKPRRDLEPGKVAFESLTASWNRLQQASLKLDQGETPEIKAARERHEKELEELRAIRRAAEGLRPAVV